MSLILDGSTQYATGPGAVWPVDEGTCMVWVKHDLEETDDGAWKYWDVTTLRNTLAHRDSDNGFQYYIDGRTQNFTFTGGWTTSEWVPIVGRWKKTGSSILLALGAVSLTPEAQSGTWGANTPGTEFWLGVRITASSEFFDGKMAWLSLYDRQILKAEEDDLMIGLHPSLVDGWIDSWPLIEDALALNGSDALTLVGSPTFDDADNPDISGTDPTPAVGPKQSARSSGELVMEDRATPVLDLGQSASRLSFIAPATLTGTVTVEASTDEDFTNPVTVLDRSGNALNIEADKATVVSFPVTFQYLRLVSSVSDDGATFSYYRSDAS
jgi:hypothetical protein